MAKKSKQHGTQKKRKSELNGKCTSFWLSFLEWISYYSLLEPITSETCLCYTLITITYFTWFQGLMVSKKVTLVFREKLYISLFCHFWRFSMFLFTFRTVFELFFHDGDSSCPALHNIKSSKPWVKQNLTSGSQHIPS